MIKNIVFDLGGVLLTDEDVGFLFENEYLKSKLKIDENKLQEVWKNHWREIGADGVSINAFYDSLQKDAFGKPDPDITVHLIEEYYKLSRPLEAYYFLPTLKSKFRLFVLTNMTSYGLEFKRKKFELDKYFDLIISSSDEKVSKPDIKIFEILLKKTKINPKESLFIDNSERNIKSAQTLGFHTILFENKQQMIIKMKELGLKI